MNAEVDLADSEGSKPPRDVARPLPYDPAQDRERVRGRVAYVMIALLTAVVATILGGVILGLLTFDGAEKMAAIILSPVVGLLGAVLGFYYGEQSRRQ